jgi:hypothetical protein
MHLALMWHAVVEVSADEFARSLLRARAATSTLLSFSNCGVLFPHLFPLCCSFTAAQLPAAD